MTKPDYRAMCAELLAAIQLYTQLNPAASDMSAFELTEKLMDAMAATVAALAQPVAEVPTDEELREMLNENDWNYISPETFEDIARTVLAQWGRPAAAPVAIPGEEYHEDMGPVTWWRLPVDEPPWVGTPNDSDWPGYHTHFTPAPTNPLNAHALPTPEAKP